MDDLEWMESRPESLKDAPYFKDAEDGVPRTVAQLVSDITNAASLQGNLSESHIRLPPPDSAQEDIDSFRARVLKADDTLTTKGDDFSPVPTEVDGYKDVEIEGFKEDTAIAKDMALKNKWSQTQYEGFVNQMAADHKAGLDGRAAWLAAQSTELDGILGTAKADHMARTIAAIGEKHPEVAQALSEGGVDAKTVLVIDSLVHKMLDMGGEAGEFNAQAGAGGRTSTPSEAANQANDLRLLMQTTKQSSREYGAMQAKLVELTRLSRPH
jgi:hypothetical protein